MLSSFGVFGGLWGLRGLRGLCFQDTRLSRVRNSSALHILNLNKNKIKVTEKVKSEMSRLRTEANLVPLAVLQTDNASQTKTILF